MIEAIHVHKKGEVMTATVDCHVGFQGLFGIAKARDRYVILIPNLSDPDAVLGGRLPKVFWKDIMPHQAQVLVESGIMTAANGQEFGRDGRSVFRPEFSQQSRNIYLEQVEITGVESDPQSGALEDLVALGDLLAHLPGSSSAKELSPELFESAYHENPSRIIGRVEFPHKQLDLDCFPGDYRFQYVPLPARQLARELSFKTKVDRSTGLVLKVRPLEQADPTGSEVIQIKPVERKPIKVRFEHSPGLKTPQGTDFVAHYNLLSTPQALLGYLPYPFRFPRSEKADARDLGPEALNPQCSPVNYGDEP